MATTPQMAGHPYPPQDVPAPAGSALPFTRSSRPAALKTATSTCVPLPLSPGSRKSTGAGSTPILSTRRPRTLLSISCSKSGPCGASVPPGLQHEYRHQPCPGFVMYAQIRPELRLPHPYRRHIPLPPENRGVHSRLPHTPPKSSN